MKKVKKLLLITDFFRPEPGGLEGFFTGIARRWPKDHCEVIISSKEKNYLTSPDIRRRFDENEKYPIKRISGEIHPSIFSSQRSVFRNLLQNRLQEFKPTHIIFGQITRETSGAFKDIKDLNIDFSLLLNGSDIKNRLGIINRLFLMKKFRYIFVPSRHLGRAARNAGIPDEKIIYLPPGMEMRIGFNKKTELPAELLRRTKNKKLVIGAGSLLPRKGYDLAITMLKRHPDLQNKIHLLLCGSGPEFHYLQEKIRLLDMEKHVTLTGFIRDEHFAACMRLADLYIQPGCERDDDIGGPEIAIMEAAQFGLPALVGDVGGQSEVVKDGVSGFVLKPGDIDDLADKIRECINSDSLRNKLGRNAKILARKEFGIGGACRTIYKMI
ncbi:MAG: glycosyltransferase [Spirochaetia bacterium]|nr:glycosyltransferase [Spirochaetia bacterium]